MHEACIEENFFMYMCCSKLDQKRENSVENTLVFSVTDDYSYFC